MVIPSNGNSALRSVVYMFAAMAVDAGHHGDNKRVVKNVIVTIICGGTFLVIKLFEYKSKYEHGLWPGAANYFEYKNFLGLYYCMTALHALHVVIGMCLLGWVLTKALKNRFSDDYYTPVEIGALY